MKLSTKIITLLLAIVIVLSISVITVFAGIDTPAGPVPDQTKGDLNGDKSVTSADAVHLLLHTYFPSEYTVDQNCDFNGDGVLTDADAVYLIKHVNSPAQFPLN